MEEIAASFRINYQRPIRNKMLEKVIRRTSLGRESSKSLIHHRHQSLENNMIDMEGRYSIMSIIKVVIVKMKLNKSNNTWNKKRRKTINRKDIQVAKPMLAANHNNKGKILMILRSIRVMSLKVGINKRRNLRIKLKNLMINNRLRSRRWMMIK